MIRVLPQARLQSGNQPALSVTTAWTRGGDPLVFPEGWPFPIYALGKDGELVWKAAAGAVTRADLSAFDLDCDDRETLQETLFAKASELCLMAGFAGTAIFLVHRVGSYSADKRGRHFFVGSIAFTGRCRLAYYLDDEMLRPVAGIPDSIPMGENEEKLEAGLLTYQVLET